MLILHYRFISVHCSSFMLFFLKITRLFYIPNCRAFGVLMWEIFTSGFIPYPGLQNNDVMTFVRKGGRLEIPAICPQSMYVSILITYFHCWPFFQYFLFLLRICKQQVLNMLLVLHICIYIRHFVMLEFFRYDLMCWCWQNDTVERPSFQTIYKFLVITHKVRVVFFPILLTYRHVLIRPVILGEVL